MSIESPLHRGESAGCVPNRVFLQNMCWDLYVRLRDDDANRHVRMDYFRGTLRLTASASGRMINCRLVTGPRVGL